MWFDRLTTSGPEAETVMKRVELYDTTLRDGAQMEGISYSVEDKLKIARKLDGVGVHYIEGGWPGANPKDAEFFVRVRDLHLQHSRLAAFGSTRRAAGTAEGDPNLKALVDARTPVVTIVGKSWDLHVHDVLTTTLEENLAMVADSVRFLKRRGLTVIFDAEHFFDGHRDNPEYAVAVARQAAEAGADCLVLCDTNGGSLPRDVGAVTAAVAALVALPLGIHAHNDGELAVANSLAAVQNGATHVQGTINGYGERCGNANLCSIIADLQLKLGIPVVDVEQLARLTEISHFVSEVANLAPFSHQPYVGISAFAHKGGIHVAAQLKNPRAYQHLDPAIVGNQPRVVVSELSGAGNIIYKAREMGIDLANPSAQARQVLEHIKRLENQGFQFEAAEASFELLLARSQESYQAPFELVDFMVIVEKHRRPPKGENGDQMLSEATVKVRVGDEVIHTVAEGNGPVNALDAALRKGLLQYYPSLAAVKLTDYKVRILDEAEGTGAQVRVLIQSSDGDSQWSTVGSSANIIEASWLALADALEYWLLKRGSEATYS